MELELGTLLKIPRGEPGANPLEFELSEIISLENRKKEVSYATKETAPELMHAFNSGYCSVTKMMAQVSYEYSLSKRYAERRRAIVLLDIAPGEIERRKLKSSEDLRNAVLSQDEEYWKLMDKVNMLEAVYEFLRSKAKGFEMSYQSAKKIFDITYSGLGTSYQNLTTEEASPVESNLIGIPRY